MNGAQLAAEQFSALRPLAYLGHAFTRRVPGLEMSHDKAEALARLDHVHRSIRAQCGLDAMPFVTARQVHGKEISVVASKPNEDRCFSACDGLVTNQPGVCLGIYVADCCAVYLVDPNHRAIGLVHSGKKGTELAVVPNAVKTMNAQFGSVASDLIVQLSPCIRPPHYEIDFASEIIRQCRALGIAMVEDCGVCTACDLTSYYSYRAEKGRTGRMLALMALL